MFSWLKSEFKNYALKSSKSAARRQRNRQIFLETLEKREVFAIALVSSATTTAVGNASSVNADVSDDHRYVVFESIANNLVTGDNNNARDIFLKDLTLGTLTLISTDSSGNLGDSDSSNAVISGDGKFVAFESNATNLVAGDTNGFTDVFVKNLTTGATVRVSQSASGVQGNGGSSNASISSDGRYVAFDSGASNFVSGDTNGVSDIFRKDTTTNAIVRASVTQGNVQGNGASFEPSITANGRNIVFTSFSNNLVTNDTNGEGDIFTKDVTSGGITLDSRGPSFQGDGLSSRAKISDDARYVIFESVATTLVNNDTNGVSDIFLRDRQANVTIRVSQSQTNAQSNGGSFEAAISADGKYAVFQSVANNLITGDTNNRSDVFEKELVSGKVNRWSKSDAGVQGNGDSFRPQNTADARYVVFDSESTNIYAGDTNNIPDVYFQTINGVPVAAAASYTTQRDTPLAITLVGTDPENDTLTYRITQQPANGRVTGSGSRVTYVPTTGFTGTDTFQYVVNDGRGDSVPATITISVTGGGGTGNDNQYLIGFNPVNGQWYGSHFADGTSRVLTTWDPAAGWTNGLVADFNGDGLTDIAARTSTGRWWVGIARTGGLNPAFTTSLWGGSSKVTFQKTVAADVDGDGSADIVSFSNALQSWQVLNSTGTRFNIATIAWRKNVTWTDYQVSDFNGDGKADLAARLDPTSGVSSWYVGISAGNGSTFNSSRWNAWEDVTWRDVMVGDFNNDGRADIVGRMTTGEWRFSPSTGTSLRNINIGSWQSDAAGWQNVMAGDFDGDGQDDVVGRTSAGDWYRWYLSGNAGVFPAASIGNWATNYRSIFSADVGNDGKVDLLGRSATGTWRVDTLDAGGTSLVQSTDPLLAPTWNAAVNWLFADLGEDDGTVF